MYKVEVNQQNLVLCAEFRFSQLLEEVLDVFDQPEQAEAVSAVIKLFNDECQDIKLWESAAQLVEHLRNTWHSSYAGADGSANSSPSRLALAAAREAAYCAMERVRESCSDEEDLLQEFSESARRAQNAAALARKACALSALAHNEKRAGGHLLWWHFALPIPPAVRPASRAVLKVTCVLRRVLGADRLIAIQDMRKLDLQLFAGEKTVTGMMKPVTVQGVTCGIHRLTFWVPGGTVIEGTVSAP